MKQIIDIINNDWDNKTENVNNDQQNVQHKQCARIIEWKIIVSKKYEMFRVFCFLFSLNRRVARFALHVECITVALMYASGKNRIVFRWNEYHFGVECFLMQTASKYSAHIYV